MTLNFIKRVMGGLRRGSLPRLAYKYFARLCLPFFRKTKRTVALSLASRFPGIREKALGKALSSPEKEPSAILLRLHLECIYQESGSDGIACWLSQYDGIGERFHVNLACFQILAPNEPVLATYYGHLAINTIPNNYRKIVWLVERMARVLKRIGRLSEAYDLLVNYEFEVDAELLHTIKGDMALLKEGFQYNGADSGGIGGSRGGGQVLYLAHYSLPYVTNGYVTRTHGLLKALIGQGQNLECLTRLGFPYDTGMKILGVEDEHTMDRVPYFHMPSFDSGYNISPMHEYLQKYTQAVIDFASFRRPALIHCASNFINGIAGTVAAKALGIPSVYEVRGLWEYTRASRDPSWEGSDHFNMMVRLETQAAQQADIVLTLTEGLRDELVRRGVDEEKVHLLPNGVDVSRFQPLKKSRQLIDRYNLYNKLVLGYIGSVVDYEGLDDLLHALKLLKERNITSVSAVIVGDGNALSVLKKLVAHYDLSELVHLVGKVGHEEVEEYYSVIDIAVFPRKPLKVCELVSPLKPFEAMAMEKPVIVSSVQALKEIVDQSGSGMVFDKGCSKSLANTIEYYLSQPEAVLADGHKGRSWVVRERSWSALAGNVMQKYATLAGS